MKGQALIARIADADLTLPTGRVHRISATSVQADGPDVPLGTLCAIEVRGPEGRGRMLAETARIDRDSVTLVPLETAGETFLDARVSATDRHGRVPVGDAFLDRAIDALGRPIDGYAPIPAGAERRPLRAGETAPLTRETPRRMIATGIAAIDAFLPLGRGQRIGIFAASGVGKTTLMTQLARQMEADICIMCLIGERGREVETLWSDALDADARARSVLVAATSDQSAAMRVRAADYALVLAEYWRAQGRHVLLLLDSVTRLAMAMREIGLAAGEPPTVRAYTPGVFAKLPKLVERCGALKDSGSITAVMTVLSETDDLDDPISETMKSILDGHILLSRTLAEQGQYPAIDIAASVSRFAAQVVEPEKYAAAMRLAGLLGRYDEAHVLIETGVYEAGSDAEIDEAIAKRPALRALMRQAPTAFLQPDETWREIETLAEPSR
ncbi:MAG: FliI/YscN family ATPase [Pseudomonadota bacterium]